MLRAASLVCLLAMLWPEPTRAQTADPDPWFGKDKPLHFGASAALAAGGYAGSALVYDDEPHRLLLGGGLALTAGVAKELYDLTGAGDPSWKDLTWDVLGTAAGLAVTWAIDHFLLAPNRHKPRVQPTRTRVVPDGPFLFQGIPVTNTQ